MILNPDVLIEYQSELTPAAFHASGAFVRALMGPIGSGKSVACIQAMFRIGLAQEPGPDGIAHSRWAVIRNTFPELKSTTIKSFEQWFGRIAKITYGSPIEAVIEIEGFRMEFFFLSMDLEKDVKKLLSLELTGIFINEAKEIRKSVLDMGTGRVGRYPAKKDGGPTRSCVILDTNPPDNDSWLYKLFEEERPEGYELFKQPPALLKVKTNSGVIYLPNPKCENVKHQPLGYTYWLRQVPGKREEWINSYILGLYGSSHDGRPCYPSYNDSMHCSEESITTYKGIPLLIGVDFGRTPAAVIGQLSPGGQLRVIDEVVVDPTGEGMGIRKFTREVLRPHLAQHYAGVDQIIVWGDPAGVAKGNNEETAFDIMAQEGLPAEPAGSNIISFRLGNVEYFLDAMVDGEPGLVLDPKCKQIRKGFLGAYQYERLQLAGDTRFKDVPMKNSASHPADALQYLADLARHGSTKVATKVKVQPVEAAPVQFVW